MAVLGRPAKVAGQLILNIVLGSLAALVLLQGLLAEFTYYALFAVPVLALWVLAGVLLAILKVDARLGRAYLFANIGTLASAVVLLVSWPSCRLPRPSLGPSGPACFSGSCWESPLAS
jgi:hypothetical protein